MHPTDDPLLSAMGLAEASALCVLERKLAFVTSHTGRLLFADESCLTFIEGGQFILEQDGQIIGASPSNQRALEVGLGSPDPVQILLVGQDTGDFASCNVTPSAEARLWRAFRLEGRQPCLPSGFAQAFNLTPSEASLCQQLIQPGKEAVIAKALGLSPETVRTHRKRIYMKLAVTERAELIHLAWRLSGGL